MKSSGVRIVVLFCELKVAINLIVKYNNKNVKIIIFHLLMLQKTIEKRMINIALRNEENSGRDLVDLNLMINFPHQNPSLAITK